MATITGTNLLDQILADRGITGLSALQKSLLAARFDQMIEAGHFTNTQIALVLGSTPTIAATVPEGESLLTNLSQSAADAKDVIEALPTDPTEPTEPTEPTQPTETTGGGSESPTLLSSTPGDNANNFDPAADIVLTFSESLLAGGPGYIVLSSSDDNSPIAQFNVSATTGTVYRQGTEVGSYTLNGASLTLDLTDSLAPGAGYYITIAPDAIRDAAGNYFSGISSPYALDFITSPLGDTPVNVLGNEAYAYDTMNNKQNKVAVSINGSSVLTDIQFVSNLDGTFTVELVATHGTLTVADDISNGLQTADISGNGTETVTLTGSKAAINATLAGSGAVVFTAEMDYTGDATVSIATSDDAGTPNTDTDTIHLAVMSFAFDLTDEKLSITGGDGDPAVFLLANQVDHLNPTKTPYSFLDAGWSRASILDPGGISEVDASGVTASGLNGISLYWSSSGRPITITGSDTSDQLQVDIAQLGASQIDGGASADTLNIERYSQGNSASTTLEDTAFANIQNIEALSLSNYSIWDNVANVSVPGTWNFIAGSNLQTMILGNEGKTLSISTDSNLDFDGSALTDPTISLALQLGYSGAGNDTLIGGAGDDIIGGGLGADVIDGGAGNDTYRFGYYGNVYSDGSSDSTQKKQITFVDDEDKFDVKSISYGAGGTENAYGANAVISTDQSINLDESGYLAGHQLFILNAGDIAQGKGFANSITEFLDNFSTSAGKGFVAASLSGGESFVVATAATSDYANATVNLWFVSNDFDNGTKTTIGEEDFVLLIGTFTGGGTGGNAADFTTYLTGADFV